MTKRTVKKPDVKLAEGAAVGAPVDALDEKAARAELARLAKAIAEADRLYYEDDAPVLAIRIMTGCAPAMPP